MSSQKSLARIAGILYLLVGIFGGFAEGFVDPKMYVAGNAAATAANIVTNSALARLGVVSHLLDGTFFVFLALTLYTLLQHVNKSVARVFHQMHFAGFGAVRRIHNRALFHLGNFLGSRSQCADAPASCGCGPSG